MFGIRVQGGFTICISCSHTGIISASEVIAVRVCIVSLRSLVMALSKKRKFSGVPDVEEAPYQPKDCKLVWLSCDEYFLFIRDPLISFPDKIRYFIGNE